MAFGWQCHTPPSGHAPGGGVFPFPNTCGRRRNLGARDSLPAPDDAPERGFERTLAPVGAPASAPDTLALAPTEEPDARELLFIGRANGKSILLAVRIGSKRPRLKLADLKPPAYVPFDRGTLCIYYAAEDPVVKGHGL